MKKSNKVHPIINPNTIDTSTAVANPIWGISQSTVDRSLLGGSSLNPGMDSTLDQICATRLDDNHNNDELYNKKKENNNNSISNAKTISTEYNRNQKKLNVKGNREFILTKSVGRSQQTNISDINNPLEILSSNIWNNKQKIRDEGSKNINKNKSRYQQDSIIQIQGENNETAEGNQNLEENLQNEIYQQEGVTTINKEQDRDDNDDYSIVQCRTQLQQQQHQQYKKPKLNLQFSKPQGEFCQQNESQGGGEEDNNQDNIEPTDSLHIQRNLITSVAGRGGVGAAALTASSLYQQTQTRIITQLSCYPKQIPPSPALSLFTQIMPFEDQELVKEQQQQQLNERNLENLNNPIDARDNNPQGKLQQCMEQLSEQQYQQFQQSQQDEDQNLFKNTQQNLENDNKLPQPEDINQTNITINQQQQQDLLLNAPSICRICMESVCTKETGQLIHPCRCSGSMEFIHTECLKTWILTQSIEIPSAQCEVCHTTFIQHITFAPAFLLRNALTDGKKNCLLSVIFFCIFLCISAAFTYLLFKSLTTSDSTSNTGFLDDETNRISLLCVCSAIMVVLLIIVLLTFREACWITAIKTWEICNINQQENNQNNCNNINVDNNNRINNNNDNNAQSIDMGDHPPGNDNFNQNDLSNANNRHNLSNNYNQQQSLFETIQQQQPVQNNKKNILRQSMSSPTFLVPEILVQNGKEQKQQQSNKDNNNQNVVTIQQNCHVLQPFRSAGISRNTSKSNISYGHSSVSSQKQLKQPIKNVLYNKCLFVQNKHRSGTCTPARVPEY